MPYSPGLRRPRRYPGSVSENRNNRNAVVPRQRTAGSFCTGWAVVIQTNRGVARSAASGHVPRTSPVWCGSTTPSGLLICWAFTQGSASVAQPWALWQNPVGIPGGEYPTPSEHTPSSLGFPEGIVQRFPHLCSSAPSVDKPSPTPTGVVPYSPGLRRPWRYPGSVSENRNNRNAVVPRQRTAGSFCTGWAVVIQTNRGVARSAASGHVPRTSPVWCGSTTPSGLLICWAFTQGSASVAQPWALWQNPVGIPGGGYPTPSEHTPSSSRFPKGYCQRFPHLCSSAPSADKPSTTPKALCPSPPGLFVAQGLNGVQSSCFEGGEQAGDNPHPDAESDGNQHRPGCDDRRIGRGHDHVQYSHESE